MRTLGIDFGERRIGLAISDPAGRIALPLAALQRSTDRRAVYQIAALARREGVERVVMGEPRDLEGRPQAAGERVRRFGNKLAKATRLPLHYVDEALTTVEASERLRRVGADDPTRQERRDMVAAQIILEEGLAMLRQEQDSTEASPSRVDRP